MLSEQLQTELKQYVAAAVTPREAAVHVMKELQRHYGWLTDAAVKEAATLLGLSPLQVEELATFYEMIYRRPVGRRVVHVCDSISCWAMGGDSLLQRLAARLGIGVGETTGDGNFTLLPCCCLGNCDEAPTLMIGDIIYGRVSLETAEEILRHELAAAAPPKTGG